MADLYSGDRHLNKIEIRRETGLTNYYIDRAIDELKKAGVDIEPSIRPGRGNEKLFSPEQVRAIQQKVDEIIRERL